MSKRNIPDYVFFIEDDDVKLEKEIKLKILIELIDNITSCDKTFLETYKKIKTILDKKL